MSLLIEPEVPTLFGNVLKYKTRAFACKSGQAGKLHTPLLDGGSTFLLENKGLDEATWKALYVEAVSLAEGMEPVNRVEAGVDNDNDSGNFTVDLPADVTNIPAVYSLSVGAFGEEENLLFSNEFLVYVEPSVWKTQSTLPTLDSIRLLMRDSDILENELTHEKQFSLTDICSSAILAVEQYNCTPPRLPEFARTTANFPDTDLFKTGIQANLFKLMVEHYRKNALAYQTAGIAINDNKLNEYMLGYKEASQQYIQDCMRIKVQMNLSGATAIVGGIRFRRSMF